MTGHVLKFLGDTKLELGPVEETDGNWRTARDGDNVLWLVLDKTGSSVNTISEDVIRELDEHIAAAEAEKPAALVIRSAKKAGFAAGADITGFESMTDQGAADLLRQAHDVLDRIEALPCATICVVHGAAPGPASNWRSPATTASPRPAHPSAFEVQLGLHPGLGGTFRLPALIDPTDAMTMMLTGKTAHTKRAKSQGIADKIVEERHVATAITAARNGKIERQAPSLKSALFRSTRRAASPPARCAARRKRKHRKSITRRPTP